MAAIILDGRIPFRIAHESPLLMSRLFRELRFTLQGEHLFDKRRRVPSRSQRFMTGLMAAGRPCSLLPGPRRTGDPDFSGIRLLSSFRG